MESGNKKEEKEIPLVRAQTQAETLREGNEILEQLGGRPETRLRQNPKQVDNPYLNDDGEDEKEKKKRGRKNTSKSYSQLAFEAIKELGKANGSSFVAICRYIETNYTVPSSFQTHVMKGLEKAIEDGKVEKNKKSYKFAGSFKASSRSPSPKRSKSPGPKRSKSPSPSKKEKSPGATKGSRKKKADTSSPTTSSPSSSKKRKTDCGEKPVAPLKRVPSTTLKAGARLKGVQTNGIEIIFSFDTTGSMCAYLDEVKNKLGEMVTALVEDIPNIKIGVIAHGDYCDELNYYLLKKHDFSSDASSLQNWIKTVDGTGGGDIAEAYEYVLQEAQKFAWSDDCERVLVVIGDAYPHKPNEYRNIDWRAELKALVQLDVRVYGVQVGSDTTSAKFFEEIAEESYGSHLKLDEFQQLKELMMGLCFREAAEVHFQKHINEINSVDDKGATKLMMPENASDSDDNLNEEEILKIHNAIHDQETSFVELRGKKYDIAAGKAGCRFVRIEEQGLTFIEQNKQKDDKYARMALDGKTITWIVRAGKWGLIVDNDIQDK